jgi:hypothetical protein
MRCDPVLQPQVNYLSHLYSRKPIDSICRFERLTEDVKPILERFSRVGKLPHRNQSERRGYRGYFDRRLQDEVAAFYARDIEQFGYEF